MKTTTQNKTRTSVNENTQSAVELHKAGVTTISITSLLLGSWAVACMTAGIIASGGPVGLATNYIKALIG
ncbi:MAG: hypothetical protein KJ990_09585 [Proteobacteria bacterium]|nr:hypothetical protein [Pseudomonadota bacterium]MBU1648071.1 hypothetical protein [Pseudomonadota bacterium]